jgi:hypothetical protein
VVVEKITQVVAGVVLAVTDMVALVV